MNRYHNAYRNRNVVGIAPRSRRVRRILTSCDCYDCYETLERDEYMEGDCAYQCDRDGNVGWLNCLSTGYAPLRTKRIRPMGRIPCGCQKAEKSGTDTNCGCPIIMPHPECEILDEIPYSRPTCRPFFNPLPEQTLPAVLPHLGIDLPAIDPTVRRKPKKAVETGRLFEKAVKAKRKLQYVGGTAPLRGPKSLRTSRHKCGPNELHVPRVNLWSVGEMPPDVMTRISSTIYESPRVTFCDSLWNPKDQACIGVRTMVSQSSQSPRYRRCYCMETQTEDCPSGLVLLANLNGTEKCECARISGTEKCECARISEMEPECRLRKVLRPDTEHVTRECEKYATQSYEVVDRATDYKAPIPEAPLHMEDEETDEDLYQDRFTQLPMMKSNLATQYPGDKFNLMIAEPSCYTFCDVPAAYCGGKFSPSACHINEGRTPDCKSIIMTVPESPSLTAKEQMLQLCMEPLISKYTDIIPNGYTTTRGEKEEKRPQRQVKFKYDPALILKSVNMMNNRSGEKYAHTAGQLGWQNRIKLGAQMAQRHHFKNFPY